jgi:hypothetical protein
VIAYVLASLLLIVPCCWQARIQAGDLSSHIYNAWLAEMIESGRTQGLMIVHQNSNVLFDLILARLLNAFGAVAAQRIAVSLAVLIFVWGTFALVSAMSGRRSWHHLPGIAMLAYGWVFHIGFFNFYLSLGLCCFALALAWQLEPRRLAGALPIFVLAYLGHALPVAWALCILCFLGLTRRAGRLAHLVTILSPPLLVILRLEIAATWPTAWSPRQVLFATGLDQIVVYDSKYLVPLVGLSAIWVLRLLQLVRTGGVASVVSGVPFQIALMTAAGITLLPTAIRMPGFHHALVFIAERMSLASGILVCGVLGAIPHRPFERYVSIAVMLLFFAFLYRDERALNAVEDRLENAVTGLPPKQRVVSAINDPSLRINALTHMIDRACVGRCYSYANYEPSTAAFRVRAVAENPIVAFHYADSWALQTGTYVVKEADLPMFAVGLNEAGQLAIRNLQAGTRSGRSDWMVLPPLLSAPCGVR